MSELSLWPFQVKGIAWLHDHPRAILADEQGLGKTISSLKTVEDNRRILIVASKKVKLLWKQEIMTWYPDIDPASIVISGEGGSPHYKYFITHWDALSRSPGLLKVKWDSIIADESHKVKNRKTVRAKALKKLHADQIILATGTPIVNRPDEIWSLLNYLNPKEFSSYWRFFHDFVHSQPNIWGGYEILGVKDAKRLTEVLRPYVIRRLKKSIFGELPIIEQNIPVELDPDQRRAYNQMRDEMVAQIDPSTFIMSPTVLSQITRLRQIAIGMGFFNQDLDAPGAKLDVIEDLMEERVGKPTVITSQFRWPLLALEKRLTQSNFRCGLLMGGMKDADALSVVNDFQAGKYDVLLMTMQTGSEAWTFTIADTMVFVDKPWSPLMLSQAKGRLREHLQKRPVHYIYLQAVDTVEQRVQESLDRKADIFHSIFGLWREIL